MWHVLIMSFILPEYVVNVFVECCVRNLEDLTYKSELDRFSLIKQRNVYTSLVNHALNLKTFQAFISLHKIHRVMRRKAINMSEHAVQCNYCHHTVVEMQHDAKIVPGIFQILWSVSRQFKCSTFIVLTTL